MTPLADRTAFVTGSSRGIGATTAKLLAERGASVGVNYLSSDARARAVVAEIERAGGEAMAVQADVREPSAVDAAVEAVADRFGGVDIVVNNARIPYEKQAIGDMEWADFEPKYVGELKAAFTVTKAALPGMVDRGFGRFVYVSTELARAPAPGFVAHGTANGALEAFSRYVAEEYGDHDITSNVVAPGLVRTDATAGRSEAFLERIAAETPLDRIATPEDVAGVVAMLVGPDAGFVTGTYTPVNGGTTME